MKDLKRYFIIKAEPSEAYLACINPISVSAWTGEEAIMSNEVGSEFSLWDGSIVGVNLEFEEDKKIVQEWFFGDNEEKCITTFIFHSHKKGTSVEVKQVNIPSESFENIKEGWDEIYIPALIDFFN